MTLIASSWKHVRTIDVDHVPNKPYVHVNRSDRGRYTAELGGLDPIVGAGSTEGIALTDLVAQLEAIVHTIKAAVGTRGGAGTP